MPRKRIISFLSIIILSLYAVTVYISFHGAESYELSDYWHEQTTFESSIDQIGDKAENLDMLVSDIQFMMLSYPVYAEVWDKDGHIVAKSGANVVIYDGDSQECVFLEDYLTPQDRKSIRSFLKKSDNMNYSVKEIKYYKEKGRNIPVSLTLIDESDNKNEPLTIDFKNKNHKDIKTATLGKCDIDSDFYSMKERFYRLGTYKKLVKFTREMKDKNFSDSTSGHRYTSTDGSNMDFKVTCAGKEYYVYCSTLNESFKESLFSYQFRTLFVTETVLFALINFLSVIAIRRFFEKNEQLELSKKSFINAAAHELKTPLAIMENQCEFILEDIAPEKNKEYTESIYEEVLRMNDLVATLLQYNRLANVTKLDKTKCRIEDIAQTEILKYKKLFEEKNLNVTTDFISKKKIHCNADLIALVIDNFLSNAVKHTPQNGSIIIKAVGHKNGVKFSVANSGSSIDLRRKRELWNTLYRTDKARNSSDKSTGMGLSICKRILELHKYSFDCSNTQLGVEFYFIAK